MALGGNLVSTADNPGIFGWTVLAEFFEELFETGFELADGAVALEAQGNITGRRHVLVYVRIGQRASRRVSGEARRTGKGKDALAGALSLENRFIPADTASLLRITVAAGPGAFA